MEVECEIFILEYGLSYRVGQECGPILAERFFCFMWKVVELL